MNAAAVFLRIENDCVGWVRAVRRIGSPCLLILGFGTGDRSLAAAEPPATRPAKKIVQRRTAGEDWPRFLGPTGDNKSSERGILTRWPAAGPPIVWQLPLGTGYGSPTVSQGRLFQFDRKANQARLRCLESETGEPLWKFEYPTDYLDQYGYDNGPRASPVVDEDRVYLFQVPEACCIAWPSTTAS